jgi:ATP-binding cassette subfamily B protein
LGSLAGAAISWKEIALLYRAASRPLPAASADLLRLPPESEAVGRVADGRDLVFRYPRRPRAVLDHLGVRIARGSRIYLEGPSGGGKSTLASILAGLREPESGLLLIEGIEHRALGARAAREAVASAPQFHENHVLTETFAFNLLLARGWPPTQRDLEEAEQVCRELGLDELIRRMPAGLMQMVGESGWQLSHGERSRLFVARALLQGARLVILDESLAALDPENVEKVMQCVERRAATLLIVGHP